MTATIILMLPTMLQRSRHLGLHAQTMRCTKVCYANQSLRSNFLEVATSTKTSNCFWSCSNKSCLGMQQLVSGMCSFIVYVRRRLCGCVARLFARVGWRDPTYSSVTRLIQVSVTRLFARVGWRDPTYSSVTRLFALRSDLFKCDTYSSVTRLFAL
jgi:hypothetical protein